MADVKVCDRCGKILQNKRVVAKINMQSPTRLCSLVMELFGERYGGWWVDKTETFDICSDCCTELLAFLSTPKEVGDSE